MKWVVFENCVHLDRSSTGRRPDRTNSENKKRHIRPDMSDLGNPDPVRIGLLKKNFSRTTGPFPVVVDQMRPVQSL